MFSFLFYFFTVVLMPWTQNKILKLTIFTRPFSSDITQGGKLRYHTVLLCSRVASHKNESYLSFFNNFHCFLID